MAFLNDFVVNFANISNTGDKFKVQRLQMLINILYFRICLKIFKIIQLKMYILFIFWKLIQKMRLFLPRKFLFNKPWCTIPSILTQAIQINYSLNIKINSYYLFRIWGKSPNIIDSELFSWVYLEQMPVLFKYIFALVLEHFFQSTFVVFFDAIFLLHPDFSLKAHKFFELCVYWEWVFLFCLCGLFHNSLFFRFFCYNLNIWCAFFLNTYI